MTNTSSITQYAPTEEVLLHKEPEQINQENENKDRDNESRPLDSTNTARPSLSVQILDPAESLEKEGVTEISPSMATITNDSISIKPIAIAIPLGVDDDHFPKQSRTSMAIKLLQPNSFPGTLVALLCSGTILMGLAVVGTLVAKLLDSRNSVHDSDGIW